MSKKEEGTVSDLINKMMIETDTNNKQISDYRGKTPGANHTTINNGNMKTDSFIDIMEAMGLKPVFSLPNGEKFTLKKPVKKQ
jgi:hypothetical protein